MRLHIRETRAGALACHVRGVYTYIFSLSFFLSLFSLPRSFSVSSPKERAFRAHVSDTSGTVWIVGSYPPRWVRPTQISHSQDAANCTTSPPLPSSAGPEPASFGRVARTCTSCCGIRRRARIFAPRVGSSAVAKARRFR